MSKDEDERLKELHEQRLKLLDTIEVLDYDIATAERGIRAGDEPGRFLQYLGERYRTQAGWFLELGKVEQQITDFEQLRLERAERGDEGQTVQAWEDQGPQVDDLDWLRPELSDPAGEAALRDKQRDEPAQDDDLDWMPSRTPGESG